MSAEAARHAPYPVRANTKRCAKCGKIVSRSTFVCRRCGKRQRIRPRMILLGLSLCLLAGMFAVAAASVVGSTRSPGSTTVGPALARRPAAAAATATPAAAGTQEIAAADLLAAYAHDRVAADRRFKDHSLVVTGVVRSVERDFEGSIVVRLGTGDAYDTVNAHLATRGDPSLTGVNKGQEVALLCVGRGALIGAPSLGSCFLR
jgi:hypothetical protein